MNQIILSSKNKFQPALKSLLFLFYKEKGEDKKLSKINFKFYGQKILMMMMVKEWQGWRLPFAQVRVPSHLGPLLAVT